MKTGKGIQADVLKKYLMPILLVLLIIFFSIVAPSFFSTRNLVNILSQSAFTVILGVGLTLIMVAGSIDLSVGYQMSLIGIVVTKLMLDYAWNMWAAIGVGLVLGMVLGLINGLLVIKLKIFPLIATLATSYIFEGISYLISRSVTMFGFPKEFLFIGQGSIGPIPFAVILMVAALAISTFFMKKTYLGRYVYAIGSNEEAAHLAGVNVDRYRIVLYVICGLFVAVASVVLISRSGAAASSIGPGAEFTCLTGGIIGGISFRGGEGSPLGMVLGIMMLNILSNGMQMMKLGTYPQYIAEGVVLILAMALDSYERNKKSKKIIKGTEPIKEKNLKIRHRM